MWFSSLTRKRNTNRNTSFSMDFRFRSNHVMIRGKKLSRIWLIFSLSVNMSHTRHNSIRNANVSTTLNRFCSFVFLCVLYPFLNFVFFKKINLCADLFYNTTEIINGRWSTADDLILCFSSIYEKLWRMRIGTLCHSIQNYIGKYWGRKRNNFIYEI